MNLKEFVVQLQFIYFKTNHVLKVEIVGKFYFHVLNKIHSVLSMPIYDIVETTPGFPLNKVVRSFMPPRLSGMLSFSFIP